MFWFHIFFMEIALVYAIYGLYYINYIPILFKRFYIDTTNKILRKFKFNKFVTRINYKFKYVLRII